MNLNIYRKFVSSWYQIFVVSFFLGRGGGSGWVTQSVNTLCVERDTPEKPACNHIFIALF